VYNPTTPGPAEDLFCSGHTWSSFGDLVVVGGTVTSLSLASQATFLFAPKLPVGVFPQSSPPQVFYPGSTGAWIPGPPLAEARWYATAILTHRLQRTATPGALQGRETILVLGGTKDKSNPSLAANPTWDSYEALIVDRPPVATSSGLVADVDTTVPGNTNSGRTWPGPGVIGVLGNDEDHLAEYPRAHLLTNGRVFISGYPALGALVNHEHPSGVPIWDLTVGQSNYVDLARHDGASVLMPNLNGQVNHVARIGGCDES